MTLRISARSLTLGLALLACSTAALTSSCTSVARGLGGITANKYASARSGVHWPVEPPQLEPLAPDQKIAYISCRDITGTGLNLEPLIREAATAQGWQITNDPTEALIRLRGQVRFFDEVEPESGGLSQAAGMGLIVGASTALATGVAVADMTDNGFAGAAAGGVAGGLVGMGISNASKPREYALILDFVLEERLAEPATFTVASASNADQSSSSGAASSRANNSGSTGRSTSTAASVQKTSDYFPHPVRLSVWANQMNMKEDEAQPLIIAETEKVVQFLLPY
jgi:hypothetical protein